MCFQSSQSEKNWCCCVYGTVQNNLVSSCVRNQEQEANQILRVTVRGTEIARKFDLKKYIPALVVGWEFSMCVVVC